MSLNLLSLNNFLDVQYSWKFSEAEVKPFHWLQDLSRDFQEDTILVLGYHGWHDCIKFNLNDDNQLGSIFLDNLSCAGLRNPSKVQCTHVA